MYNKKYDIYCKTTYVSYKEGLKEILHTISGVEKGKSKNYTKNITMN